MGDNMEDPFENSEGEDKELERPRTPDFHHDGREEEEEEVYSEVSDDRANEQQELEETKQSPVQPAHSPDSEAVVESPAGSEGTKENVDNEVTETSEKDDLEDNKDGESDKEEKESKDDEVSEEKIIPDDEQLEEKEESGSPDNSPLQNTIPEHSKHEETNKDMTKDGQDEDEEDVEMPLSPIGDLGLSEPEAAIVDDILKGDVSEMMPDNKVVESQRDDDVVNKSANDDDEEGPLNEAEQEDKSSPKPSSPAVDDGDDDGEKKEKSEGIDDLDEERSEPEEAGDQLIADIFGASDEEEEFEGFDQEEIELSKAKQEVGSKRPSKPMISDDEDDEGVTGEVSDKMVVPKPKQAKDDSDDSDDDGPSGHQVWDFDLMMEQKKASRSKRRKKGDGDLISDNDDLVVEMIKQMQQAAEEDRMLNEAKQAATKKLKLLPLVLKHLNKADLQFTFIDSGILNGIKEWLSPLPDGSLPHLQIRTGFLKILTAFPALDTGALKMSGLGKAVMYLFRHPKEIRQNKDMAGKLINEWARPIFGITSNFKSMSREEREERDYQNMSKRRRLSSTDEGNRTPRSIDRALHGEKKAARPGEKGFIMRARVPTPSNKDYVVRPKSNLDNLDFRRNSPKLVSRVDKQMRKFKDRNKTKDAARVTISIEGRKMAL